jgi:hypothetical protein
MCCVTGYGGVDVSMCCAEDMLSVNRLMHETCLKQQGRKFADFGRVGVVAVKVK